jgi:hypothetical protein
VVSADRVLTKVHGKRAPLDRETCTESVHLGPVQPARVGVQVKHPATCTAPVQVTCTESVQH